MKNLTVVNEHKHSAFYSTIKAFMLVMLLSICSLPYNAMAAKNALTKEQTEARVTAIKERVAQIQATDFKTLTKAERRDLRKELKGMNQELRQMHPTYVYISGGGLLLIIILLILLL